MRRREMIAGGAALAVTGSVQAEAETDPHQAWLDEWFALRETFNASDDDDSPEDEAVWARMMDLNDRILLEPARTEAGMIAKHRFALENTPNLAVLGGDVDGAKALAEQTIDFLQSRG